MSLAEYIFTSSDAQRRCTRDNDLQDYFFVFSKRVFWMHPFRKTFRHVREDDECALCLEPFQLFSRCWATRCGHVFHKKCLRDLHLRTSGWVPCPLCRKDMGNLEFLDGVVYNVGCFQKKSGLDLLEEVDNLVPRTCSQEQDHFLGTQKECPTCQHYRKV